MSGPVDGGIDGSVDAALGSRVWVAPGGHIPPHSTGDEPEFTGRDELHLLNTGHQPARIEITVYYARGEPVGPYRFEVGARRVRHVRVNDLIDPEAVPYDVDYGLVLRSDQPVVLQHVRVDSRRSELSMFGSLAFPAS